LIVKRLPISLIKIPDEGCWMKFLETSSGHNF
jgi:hypothetical protein